MVLVDNYLNKLYLGTADVKPEKVVTAPEPVPVQKVPTRPGTS